MSKLIVQATTIAGKMIEAAKWEVEPPPGIQEGQTMAINLPIKDPALIKYIGKQQSLDCLIDKDKDGFSISLACKISRIRHMVNTNTGIVDSLAVVIPVNRVVESTILYMLHPAKCDPKFVHIVRSQFASQT